MGEKQEKNIIVEFGNKVGKKASEIGDKVSETAKLTFDHLNFLKHFTELDKKVSEDEKEKAIKIIETVDSLKDDKTKAEVLKNYIDLNNRKEIIEKIIYAVKYLSGTVAVIVVAVLLNQNNKK
ncbi:hypothetical protein [Bacillus cereus]|uniref:hypothetical protein n=1 Tax=Bacillus cereus TaxID=1396 RepID=UPI000B5F66B3|nr:hypothetical protein [Bacillus cereus]ASL62712.1 hypothetical protein FORC47_p360 [Bacillus cereus]